MNRALAKTTSDKFSPFMYTMLGVNIASRRMKKARSRENMIDWMRFLEWKKLHFCFWVTRRLENSCNWVRDKLN